MLSGIKYFVIFDNMNMREYPCMVPYIVVRFYTVFLFFRTDFYKSLWYQI